MKLHPQRLRSQLHISVADVRLGMFISELDRPWIETPFLLQGFVLTDPSHLIMLRDFVLDVVIDPLRSTTDSLRHLPWDALHEPEKEEQTRSIATARVAVSYMASAAPKGRWPLFESLMKFLLSPFGVATHAPLPTRPSAPYYLRHSAGLMGDDGSEPLSAIARKAALASKLTPPSSPKFSEFIESLYPLDVHFIPLDFLERIQLWWSKRGSRLVKQKAESKRPANDRPSYIPDSIPLVVYRDQTSLEDESIRARKIVRQADVVLEKIVNDIKADLPIDLEDVRPVVDVLVESVVCNPTALMWSARMHDQNKKTYMHGLKVAIYMMVLGRHLGFPKELLAELGSIGLLLDVGMLKLPGDLLEKADELTQEEDAMLTQHVIFSMEALEQAGPLPFNIARGIKDHHERMDGSGYPQQLAGESISIYGRMAAIADSFAAMTTARTYDVTHSAFDAMKELFKDAETKLHGPLVEQFVQAICIFPVGSLIELSSGEVGIVLEHNRVRRLEPNILILTDIDKTLLEHPFSLDLMAKNKSNPERTLILRGLPDGAYDIHYRDYYVS